MQKTDKIYIKKDFPRTIRVRVEKPSPDFSLIIHKDGELYYIRDFGNFDAVNINLKNEGIYTFNVPVEILSNEYMKVVCPIGREDLPEFERNYPLPDTWERDIEMGRTPARMLSKHGLIETSDKFNKLPLEWRIYILLHELAHSKYKTEWKADTLALYWFCKLGYNHSQALYSLSKVLHKDNPVNLHRIKNIYNFVKP